MSRVEILGVPVDVVTRAEFPELMERAIAEPLTAVVQPLNVDTLNKIQRDPWLADFFRAARFVYADGQGVVWGARALGAWLPERLTAADLAFDLAHAWSDGRASLYLLGGEPGVAERAAEVLRTRSPGVRIVGTWRGHLDAAGDAAVLADIAEKRPDVLAVGFGTPVQERWIAKHWCALQCVRAIWPVGAMTTYIAGTVPRAPEWMRDNGLEWAFRFGLEPRRLFRRYIIGNPEFALRIATSRAAQLVRRARKTP
jgi:N-acetylglucosaminyldiphosphoundecaprenol N-acetyl-beta-D-mannosaminyltransferase